LGSFCNLPAGGTGGLHLTQELQLLDTDHSATCRECSRWSEARSGERCGSGWSEAESKHAKSVTGTGKRPTLIIGPKLPASGCDGPPEFGQLPSWAALMVAYT